MRNRRKEIKKWRGEEKNKNKIFRDKLSGVYLMMEGWKNKEYEDLRFEEGKR